MFWPRTPKGELSPERKAILEAALEILRDPEKLRELADAFDREELPKQADILRRRANVIESKECPCGRREKGCEYHDPELNKR